MEMAERVLVVCVASCVAACGSDDGPEPQVLSTGDESFPRVVREDTTDYGEHQRTRERVEYEPLARPTPADPQRRTQWGAASVLDSVTIVEDGRCCADLDRDGLADNAMGPFLSIFGMYDDAQGDITAAIGSAETVLLFAYEALDDSGSQFEVSVARGAPSTNFAVGEGPSRFQPDPAGGNRYVVDPRSVRDDDTILKTMTATREGDRVTSHTDTLILPFTLWNVPFEMKLRHVTLTAKVQGPIDRDDDTGVAMSQGTLAGVVHVVDIYDGLNDFVAINCGCLGVEGDLFDYSGPGRYLEPTCVQSFTTGEASARCLDDPSANGLGSDCVIVATNFCNSIGALAFSVDMNTEDPGAFCFDPEPTQETPFCDGMSVAVEFTAAGAVIEGVADVE